jgi:anti-sigma factor ChrR (cupin superfamily)
MNHLGENLLEYVLGELSPEKMAAFEEHVAQCATCQMEVDAAGEEMAAFAYLAEPVLPSQGARQKLLDAIEHESPYANLVSALASLGDLSLGAMRDYVDTLTDSSAWLPGPADGITIVHVDGGPKTQGAVVGFVKIKAGGEFPEHTHCGEETVIVLQGTLIDSDGSKTLSGEVNVMATESTHTVFAGPDEDVIYFVVVFEGVDVGDDHIGPDDTRI